jgi:hypothetical protein
MNIRFVTKSVHAFLDYPIALSLVTTPFLLGIGRGNPLALWVSVATGGATFILTLFTDHKTGVIRVWPLWADTLCPASARSRRHSLRTFHDLETFLPISPPVDAHS